MDQVKMMQFEQRLDEMRKAVESDTGKYTFVMRALRGDYESIENILHKFLDEVDKKSDDADFNIISLVRVLYLLKREREATTSVGHSAECERRENIISRIQTSLSKFPWWPAKGTGNDNKDIEKVCFWSENHIMMLLSSSHLFLQHAMECHNRTLKEQDLESSASTTNEGVQFFSFTKPLCSANKWQEKLLRHYIDSKIQQGGLFETLSHVYLPYTLSALMNLIDFSDCETLRMPARKLADLIVRQLMLVTTPGNGICTFSASSRSFWRTRQRPWGHNCNQLIRLCCGEGPDNFSAMQLTDFLLTTTYRPAQESLHAFHFKGFVQERQSLPLEEVIDDLFSGIDDEEKAPLIWSAGLVVHPRFIKETKRYLERKRLGSSVPMLGILQSFGVESILMSYPHFSEGQTYCGITLNVYKDRSNDECDGSVCLTSFERFNHRRVGYQQVTWMANIGGLPIWSQSGKGSESISKFGIFNTHSPCVSQKGRLLVAAYLPPKVLTHTTLVGSVFSFVVRMFWPRPFFDEEMTGVVGQSSHRLLSESRSSIRSVFGMKQNEEEYGAIAGGVWWGEGKGEITLASCVQNAPKKIQGGKKMLN